MTAAIAGRQYAFSVERYHQMIDAAVLGKTDRVELIEGVIVAVSPRSKEHTYAVDELVRILMRALGQEWVVRAQGPLTLARSEPEPDVAVVLRSLRDSAPRHPHTAVLVAEVARSSLDLDRAMAAIYAEAGVTEYWIVDVARRCVEVHRDPDGTDYRHREIVGDDAVLRPVAFAHVEVPVTALFAPT